MMPKRFIGTDELWPFYEIEEGESGALGPFEFSDADLADYNRVTEEFNKWQDRLQGLIESVPLPRNSK